MGSTKLLRFWLTRSDSANTDYRISTIKPQVEGSSPPNWFILSTSEPYDDVFNKATSEIGEAHDKYYTKTAAVDNTAEKSNYISVAFTALNTMH